MDVHSSNRSRVLPAFIVSLMLHALVLAGSPYLDRARPQPVIVEGELLSPELPEPPAEVVPPPLPEPEPPPPEPEPLKPEPAAKPKPDPGVALPVLAAQPDPADNRAADYVVAEVPPLKSGDEIPFASKVGSTAVEDYEPSSADAGAKPDGDARGSEDPVDREVLSGFGEALRQRAAGYGNYPALALRRGWQGLVKVRVRYDRLGRVYQLEVSDSSGHQVLDEQAIRMLRQAAADFPLPEALLNKAFSVIVPIAFKLN